MYVDFHSHILPCADHGSESLEMSLAQLHNALKAGVDTIVATPHFYANEDTVEQFLLRREKAYNELVSAGTYGIDIVKAAEVRLVTGIETLDGLEKLCIEGTNYILIEFPNEPWPCGILDSVAEIVRVRRLRPICAHIDRYSHLGREKILRLNVDVQINASAFLDSRRYRKYYLSLVADDSVHVLGSDTHGDGKLTYKDFSAAVKKIGEFMPYMTKNARKILASGKVITK